jgi:hypothetical protein
MDSRQQFEEAFEDLSGWEFNEHPNRSYCDDLLEIWEKAWEASRAAIVVDTGYLLGDGDNEDSDYTLGFNQGITKADKAIRAAGITVKGDS